jgi:hypothetical protein
LPSGRRAWRPAGSSVLRGGAELPLVPAATAGRRAPASEQKPTRDPKTSPASAHTEIGMAAFPWTDSWRPVQGEVGRSSASPWADSWIERQPPPGAAAQHRLRIRGEELLHRRIPPWRADGACEILAPSLVLPWFIRRRATRSIPLEVESEVNPATTSSWCAGVVPCSAAASTVLSCLVAKAVAAELWACGGLLVTGPYSAGGEPAWHAAGAAPRFLSPLWRPPSMTYWGGVPPRHNGWLGWRASVWARRHVRASRPNGTTPDLASPQPNGTIPSPLLSPGAAQKRQRWPGGRFGGPFQASVRTVLESVREDCCEGSEWS